jgi:hypothetical protein
MCTAEGRLFGSVAEALRVANTVMDYLNSPAAELEAAGCGEALKSLGEIRTKFTAAHVRFLARFDAANAHNADGFYSSASWLAAMAKMSRKDARAAVAQMRALGTGRPLGGALPTGNMSASWAQEILDWIKKLPAQLRGDAGAIAGIEKILVQAAAGGASLDDLRTIFARAAALWQAGHPDADAGDGFDDRYVQVASTFDGAGVLRGSLTGECAAAVQAVLEALGKKAGPEDTRTPGQRFHDALQRGCELLIRARMVPDRAGADTLVMVHTTLAQLRQTPGASAIEDAWLTGQPGGLSGAAAQAAACDALTVPVVTGRADMTIIDQIITLALSAADHQHPGHGNTASGSGSGLADADDGSDAGGQDGGSGWAARLTGGAAQALRYAIARLAIDFVSGPDAIAAALRTGLLEPPFNTPSLPLDIGHSAHIPAHIRRAVIMRDGGHCAWPGGCDMPAAASDVHHLTHQKDGGPTSVKDCRLFCGFHHDTVIHRWGWTITAHPDGTSQAHSPDGHTIIRSHAPPTTRAG